MLLVSEIYTSQISHHGHLSLSNISSVILNFKILEDFDILNELRCEHATPISRGYEETFNAPKDNH